MEVTNSHPPTDLETLGSMSNNVGDNLNQQNLLNYAAASIAN